MPDAAFAALVAAVPHDAGCSLIIWESLGRGHRPYPPTCDCTRDARIAKGIAAGRESDEHGHRKLNLPDEEGCSCDFRSPTLTELFAHRDAAFARAFEEASRC